MSERGATVKAEMKRLGHVREGKTGGDEEVLSVWASDDVLVSCKINDRGEQWRVEVRREGGPTPGSGVGPTFRQAVDEVRTHAAMHRAVAENMERAITLIEGAVKG